MWVLLSYTTNRCEKSQTKPPSVVSAACVRELKCIRFHQDFDYLSSSGFRSKNSTENWYVVVMAILEVGFLTGSLASTFEMKRCIAVPHLQRFKVRSFPSFNYADRLRKIQTSSYRLSEILIFFLNEASNLFYLVYI